MSPLVLCRLGNRGAHAREDERCVRVAVYVALEHHEQPLPPQLRIDGVNHIVWKGTKKEDSFGKNRLIRKRSFKALGLSHVASPTSSAEERGGRQKFEKVYKNTAT